MLARWAHRLTGTGRQPAPAASRARRRIQDNNNNNNNNNKPGDEPAERDPPQEQEQDPDGLHREALLRTVASRRWNAAIRPDSRAFKQMVDKFGDMLQTSSVQEILEQSFTRHERSLVVPVAKRRNASLARMQRRNRARYRMLMRSKRFSDWADRAGNIEFKLAMLWFGLPVAPIGFDLDDEVGSGNDTSDDEAKKETKRRREEAARNENTLRFLNSYGKRQFGVDILRDKDKAYEAYYDLNELYQVAPKRKRSGTHHGTHRGTHEQPAPISLRGGALSDRLVDMDIEDFDEAKIDPDDTTYWPGEPTGGEPALLTPAGPSRSHGGTILQPLRKKSKELSNQPYSPMDATSSRVHFATNPVQPKETETGTGKGKEPARPPVQPEEAETGTGKGKEPARDPAATREPDRRLLETEPEIIEQRKREKREAAYAKPLSVHTDNALPLNAPPVEKVLRFAFDNVPAVSLGVLTPTEQRRVQMEHYHMRNILLDRSEKCPFRGCDRVIALADAGRMEQHLADVHAGDGCNFCDEVLFAHWTVNQKRAHFLNKHFDMFLSRGELRDDNNFWAKARPHGLVDYDRESRWTFCPRCGRNHNDLDRKADREYHDTVCFPGAPRGDWVACVKCGELHSRMERHRCREVLNTREYPYCEECGLATGLFSDLYRGKHQLECKGFGGGDEAKYCPWCRLLLEQSTKVDKVKHIKSCERRPSTHKAEGPLDDSGEPWPYQPPIEEQEGKPEQEPPEVCTVCSKMIAHLDAHMLLRHAEDEHGDFAAGFCIFCKLDWEKRGWAEDRQKKLLHLDDHIHGRKEKLAADLAETLDLDDNHPWRTRALRQKDLADVKDRREVEHAREMHRRVWEDSQALIKDKAKDRTELHQAKKTLQRERAQIKELETEVKQLAERLARAQTRAGQATSEVASPARAGSSQVATPVATPAKHAKPAATSARAGSSQVATPVPTPAKHTKPAADFDSAAAAAAAAAIARAQQIKEKGKGKGKRQEKSKEEAREKTPEPHTVVSPRTPAAAATQTPPQSGRKQTTGKRKTTAADLSYRPTGSDPSDEDDEELRAQEARERAAAKRARTANRDPSFRPSRGEDD